LNIVSQKAGRQRGFSALELLVVIGVVLIICAIAIPKLLQSRMAANEAAAFASVRAIVTAQSSYAITYPDAGYADTLTKLGPSDSNRPLGPQHAGLLDDLLGCQQQPCTKSGYDFSITRATGAPVSGYLVSSNPSFQGLSGQKSFCADQSGTVVASSACAISEQKNTGQ
jgi:prepilin-type N-terminal cleavage/methylation domain-containing protein